MIKSISFLVTFFIFFAGALQAQDQSMLQYKFEQGGQYLINQKTNQETYISADDIQQRTTNDRDADILLTVKKVNPDGSADFSARYKRIELSTSRRSLSMSVNTASDKDDLYNKLFKALVDKDFDVTIAKTGEIKTVKNMEPIFEDMIASAGKVKKKDKPTLLKFLNEQLGSDQVKFDLALVFPQYTDRQVKTGDAWTTRTETNGQYLGSLDNNWELTFSANDVTKLKSDGLFLASPNAKIDMGGGIEGSVSLKGNFEGQYVVNPATSWPTRGIISSELNGEFSFEMNQNGQQQNLKVPIRVVQNGSYVVKQL